MVLGLSILIHTHVCGGGWDSSRALREPREVFTEPVYIISKQTWLTGDAPVDWKLTNV